MGNIIKVTSVRREAETLASAINKDMKKRKIRRKAYVSSVSQKYVKTLTREGFTVRKRNYAVKMRSI